ncbi:MAG: DoxX family protein [Bacteroidota bacterium]
MKTQKILYWTSTGIIFLLFGVVTLMTSGTEMAIQAVIDLGYPVYFGRMLDVFKIIGAIVLILPIVPPRIKEWAYAGFGLDFTAAAISMWAVEGPSLHLLFPLSMFLILVISYRYYHKIYTLPVLINPIRKN